MRRFIGPAWKTALVDDEIVARPETRYALAHGDWQTVLRAYLDGGLSQSGIAVRTGISQSQISRLANGRSRDPGVATIRALCDGLGIPRRFAGLIDREEDDTNRRQFLAGSLAAAATAALAADEPDERLLMANTVAYRQLEQRTPTRLLIEPVSAHLALGRRLAEGATGHRRTRLFAAVAETAGLAGWLHADLVEPAKVRSAYQLSVAAADRSGQPLLTAYMRGSLGQYATVAGDPAQGLALIRAAAGRLPRSAPRSARAWLHALEGVALGHLGDRAALGALGAAERYVVEDDEPVWPWVFQFDHPKLAASRAVAATRLGMPRLAASAFAEAAPVRSPKQAASVTVEQARALASGGELSEACRLAVSAYDTGCRYGSERIRQAVRDFRATLPASPVTAELDERLYASYRAGR